MTDQGRSSKCDKPTRHLGLRPKLALVAAGCAFLPLVVVWGIGLYGQLQLTAIERSTIKASKDLVEELSALSAPGLGSIETGAKLHGIAVKKRMTVRVIDSTGKVVGRTGPSRGSPLRKIGHWALRASAGFYGTSGHLDLLTVETHLEPVSERSEVISALSGRSSGLWRSDLEGRIQVYYYAIPNPLAHGVLYFSRVSHQGIRELYDLRYLLLKLTLIIGAVAALLGMWIGWRLVNPLVSLKGRIERYLDSPGGWHREPLALGRTDELGELSAQFDELVSRLDRRLAETARTTADFAHDMKNPLSTITTSAELLQGDKNRSGDRVERISTAIGEAAGHMRGSVDGMLELARLDQSLSSQQRVVQSVGQLACRVAESYRVPETGDAVLVEFALSDADTNALVVPERIEQLVRNLVDNAIVFADDRVRVDVSRLNSEILLRVFDDGPGVSKGNRDKVFQRFFTSRPTGSQAGTGIGLSIVTTIAESHGGRAELSSESPDGGACFCVYLPIATQSP